MLKIAWSKIYAHPLPEEHRFPMIKYDLILEQLLYEGTISMSNVFEPSTISNEVVLYTHQLEYYNHLKNLTLPISEIRRIGFPLTKELVEREEIIMGGTLEASIFALHSGIGMNIAGGTHHAFTNRGEGFCLLNDMAIAANYLLVRNNNWKVLVIDLDVHQGNGTAQIFSKESRVFTFSMHGKNNYPYHKEVSDLDVELPDKMNDDAYLSLLQHHLKNLIEQVEPNFIFYQSGVDVLRTDKLGKLALTKEGCKERDRMVLKSCKENNIPISISMGGGYSHKISDIVDAHCNTFRLAQEIYF
jgi:acetoin utilization deacetylase AcuC-like enzyme